MRFACREKRDSGQRFKPIRSSFGLTLRLRMRHSTDTISGDTMVGQPPVVDAQIAVQFLSGACGLLIRETS